MAVFVLTVAQLAVATFVDGLPQFEGKGFGARLVAYPVMMLLVPAGWVGYQRPTATEPAPVGRRCRGPGSGWSWRRSSST